MIGSYRIIDGKNYLQINSHGTLQILPRLRWYHQVYLVFKQFFVGHIHMDEVIKLAFKKR